MRILVLLALLLMGSARIATAAEDVAAGQSIIRAQEEALGRDDAAAAYAGAGQNELAAELESRHLALWRRWDARLPNNAFIQRRLKSARLAAVTAPVRPS